MQKSRRVVNLQIGGSFGYSDLLSVTYPVAGDEPGDEPVDPETAVDDVTVGVKAVKVIRNGQMYIIRDGVIYNAMGQIAE